MKGKRAKKYFFDEMNSNEIGTYLKASDIAIIPFGSIEVHGPHLPVGCDTYIAEAFSMLLANEVNGTVLPSIKYTPAGKNKYLTGTISVYSENIIPYVENIILSLIRQSFQRIILVNIHSGNTPWLHTFVLEFFEKTKVPIMDIDPFVYGMNSSVAMIFEGKDNAYIESCLLLASLTILGKGNLVDVSSMKEDSSALKNSTSEVLAKLRKKGHVGFFRKDILEHIPPRKDISASKGMEFLQKVSKEFKTIFDDLEKYNKLLRKNREEL